MTNYSIKISTRAKHVSLKITPTDGLVVVVPRGFNHSLLDDLVASRRAWIEKNLRRYENIPPQQNDIVLPDEIYFPALEEMWCIEVVKTDSSTVRIIEAKHYMLRVMGNVDDDAACRRALRRWLMRYARQQLLTLFNLASEECQLAYRKSTVRGQRTRWGSCSSSASINLNYQLLFVSPAMMNYVFVHELCHTVHLNHSNAFYSLLESFVTDHKIIESKLKQAWRTMPAWLQNL